MLKSNFIKPKLSIDFFGKTRFWVGLFLGLGVGFLLFAFFSFFKLALHQITYMSWMGYSMESPPETRFYQILFAFLALLFGQYFFLEFVLSKPRKFLERNIRKKTILHNSRFSSWTTLFVDFKWAVSIGLLSMSNVFSTFSFYGIGWWTGILLAIWWHFFMWQEISRTFKNGRSLSVITFIGIAFLSIIFTRFIPNIYASSFRQKAKQTPHYQLKIDLPVATKNATTKLIHQTLIQTFFVGDPEENDSIRISTSWGEEIEIHSLPLLIEKFNQKVPEAKRGLITTLIAIDKEIRMKDVYKLLKTFGENHRFKFSFAALSPEQQESKLYFETFSTGLLTRIPPQCINLKPAIEMIQKDSNTTPLDLENFYSRTEYPFCEFYFGFSDEGFKVDFNFIKLSAQNEFSFDNKKIATKDLFEKIKNIIWEKKEKAIFIFDVDDNATYEHYFFLRHEHKRAMNEVRNQEALIRFGKNYEFLERVKQREIRSGYPMSIKEFFSEEDRFIFDFFRNKSSKN